MSEWFPIFLFLSYFDPLFPRNRVDDMKLEIFEGLETIPGEILQQGTKRVAAFIRGLLVAHELEVVQLFLLFFAPGRFSSSSL